MDLFALQYCIWADGESGGTCSSGEPGKPITKLPSDMVSCVQGDECPKTIVLREPGAASIVVASLNADQIRKSAKKKQFYSAFDVVDSDSITVSQFGEISYLPLSAHFGGKLTTKLTLDDNGRRSSFSWNSTATGNSFVSGLNTMADSAKAYRTATGEPTAVEDMQTQIKELETLQKLNKLEVCRTIIESGGYECPK
jgi:hypothetical protein